MKKQSWLLLLIWLTAGGTGLAEDLLIAGSTRLRKTEAFQAALAQYQQALLDSENISSIYVDLDSEACRQEFGAHAQDLNLWTEVQRVLRIVVQQTGAHDILILGSDFVLPRPYKTFPFNNVATSVQSDGWYVDFDNDNIFDEGLSVGRMADSMWGSEAICAALQTAAILHGRGGFTLDNPIEFSANEYNSPPYGNGPACEEQEAFYDLMATADQITLLMGHGCPYSMVSVNGELTLLGSDIPPDLMLENHPVIIGWYPCNLGAILAAGYPGFCYDFMRAGAAGFVARTTEYGIPEGLSSRFFDQLDSGARIGPAMFAAARAVALSDARTIATAGNVTLYGDPTLKKTTRLPCNAHRPEFCALSPGSDPALIRVQGRRVNDAGSFGSVGDAEKIRIQVRPMQVGGAAFIQKSIRGMTCDMLVTTNLAVKAVRVAGRFVRGRTPRYDSYVFDFGPIGKQTMLYFKVEAKNTLGSDLLPSPVKYVIGWPKPYEWFSLRVVKSSPLPKTLN